MAAPSLVKVDHACVAAMDLADGESQSVGRLWDRDQMDMVRHQAVRQDLDLVSAAPLPHKLQVTLIILVANERRLPTVSTLSDVVGQARCDDTCQSGHRQKTIRPRTGRQ